MNVCDHDNNVNIDLLILKCPMFRRLVVVFFFKILVPLGSIPELAATSCQEINKNEGKKLDSGKYWMSLSGTIVHVYCNMSTVPEGKFNPCTSIIIIYNEYHTCNAS